MKNVLLCVAGATPQIVTETLYVLTVQKKTRIDEIQIITTLDGREKILTGKIKGRPGGSAQESLLDPSEGQFYAFLRDYPGTAPIEFNESKVILLTDRTDMPLTDIRSIEENEVAGDQICEVVRDLCRNADLRLFASVAGGRKTMGIYLTAAMQMYARADDELTHVLVNDDFETHPQFFYPPPEPAILTLRDGRQVSTESAEISLADVPFIRLRGIGLRSDLDEHGTYKKTVDRAQAYLDADEMSPPLVIDLNTNHLSAGNLRVRISDYEMLLFTVFAQKKLDSRSEDGGFVTFGSLRGTDFESAFQRLMTAKQGERCPLTKERVGDTEWGFLLEVVSQADSTRDRDYEDLMNSLSRAIGRANRKIRAAGFPQKYEITAKGNVRPKRYGIDLPAELIGFAVP